MPFGNPSQGASAATPGSAATVIYSNVAKAANSAEGTTPQSFVNVYNSTAELFGAGASVPAGRKLVVQYAVLQSYTTAANADPTLGPIFLMDRGAVRVYALMFGALQPNVPTFRQYAFPDGTVVFDAGSAVQWLDNTVAAVKNNGYTLSMAIYGQLFNA